MNIVTLNRLDRAHKQVVTELYSLGFYDTLVANVKVLLVPVSLAYGWQNYRSGGEIGIPILSGSKLVDFFTDRYTALRDILRHEYAHAIADTHRGLMRSRKFSIAFGASHDSEIRFEFDPQKYLTPYAATSPAEDFAETFRFYVRHKGILPARKRTPALRKKYYFIHRLARAISRGGGI